MNQKGTREPGAFFVCFLQEEGSMDNKKLTEELLKRDDIQDIPAIYILRVAVAILEIINSGGCFFDTKEGQTYVD